MALHPGSHVLRVRSPGLKKARVKKRPKPARAIRIARKRGKNLKVR